MAKQRDRKQQRQRIHMRIRKTVSGTPERPRLVVFRSLRHVYAQLIDDIQRVTVAAASTVEKDLAKDLSALGNRAAGQLVGKAIAERARAKGIEKIVFDRSGFRYHGVVKELADAVRKAGLQF